jgi:hypothetical protein
MTVACADRCCVQSRPCLIHGGYLVGPVGGETRPTAQFDAKPATSADDIAATAPRQLANRGAS